MKKIIFYVFAALTIMMLPTACIEELPGSPGQDAVLSEPYEQEDMIGESVLSLRNQLFPQTKSSEGGVSSVEIIYESDLTVGTKSSGEGDSPLIRIINFDDGGYAITSADSSCCMIYAIIEEGSMSASNFIEAYNAPAMEELTLDMTADAIGEDPVLADGDTWFRDAGPDMVAKLIGDAALVCNSTDTFKDHFWGEGDDDEVKHFSGNVQKRVVDIDDEYSYDMTNRISAVAESDRLTWDQDSPFNDKCPVKNSSTGERYLAGCVAIAAAQVLVYNGFPEDGEWDWEILRQVHDTSDGTEYQREYVADFVKFIGEKENCNIRYRDNGSWGVADGAKRTFGNFGYSSVDKSIHLEFGSGAYGKVYGMVKAGKPVFVTAADGFKGHAWVFEGVAGYTYTHYVVTTYEDGTTNRQIVSQSRTHDLLYCNWGWGYGLNGYFSKDCINPNSMMDTGGYDEGETPNDDYQHSGSYDWNFRLVTYNL